jgi:hypothetical protein
MNRSDFQVAVLGIVLLHSGIGSGVLGVFLHVVEFLMRDDASCGHGFADVLGKRYRLSLLWSSQVLPFLPVRRYSSPPSGLERQPVMVRTLDFGLSSANPGAA